jgi:MFS family permease
MLSAAALLAFLFAAQLPKGGEGRPERLQRPRFGIPSRLDTWSFIQGMTLDGLFVVGISILAASAMPGYAGLAAGGALALRYIAEIMLGPSGGALAERYGPRRVLTLLSISTAVGLAVIGAGVLWVGAFLVVVLRGLIQPIPTPLVSIENPGRDRVPALARLATWRDLGAGAGPLLTGALLPIVSQKLLYGGAAVLLAASAAAVAMGSARTAD